MVHGFFKDEIEPIKKARPAPVGKDLSGLFSSNTDEWATPQDLFDRLNEEFDFDLDVCANAGNAKCAEYFTKEQDGLSKSWKGRRVFCNPPYDREVPKWMKKGYEETRTGGAFVLCSWRRGRTPNGGRIMPCEPPRSDSSEEGSNSGVWQTVPRSLPP